MKQLLFTGTALAMALLISCGRGSSNKNNPESQNTPSSPDLPKITECKIESARDLYAAIKQSDLYADDLASTLKDIAWKTEFKSRDEAGNIAFFNSIESIRLSSSKTLCPLKGLPKLRTLDLSSTEGIDLSELAALPLIDGLIFEGSKLKDFSFSSYVPRLQTLHIQGWNGKYDHIANIEPLASLPELTELRIDASHVEDLSPLAKLKKLQVLKLPRSLARDLTPLAQLPELREIDLSNCKKLRSIAPLENSINLTTLDISGSEVGSVVPLSHLVNMDSLSISNTLVSDISALSNLKRLRILAIGCRLPRRLWETCRSTTTVDDISVLSSLIELESLNLSGTRVRDIAPLATLAKLTTLELNFTGVDDISALANLSGLEDLQIGRTQVRSVLPLTALSNIKRLNIAFTPVDTVTDLGGLKNLAELNLIGTQVSSLDPLVGLASLTSVNIALSEVTQAERRRFNERQKALGYSESAN